MKALFLCFSLFGDEAETVFWEVALHYLRREKARLQCSKHKVTYFAQYVNLQGVNLPNLNKLLLSLTWSRYRLPYSFVPHVSH